MAGFDFDIREKQIAKSLSEINQTMIYGEIKFPFETNHEEYKEEYIQIAKKTCLLIDGKELDNGN